VNPLLARLSIATLGTGAYALVVRVRDDRGTVHKTEKYYFSRRNRNVDIQTLSLLSEEERLAAFVGTTRNADTLQMYVECLWPIADNADKERIITESVKKEPESMRRFVADFWQRRAADTANPITMWAQYYKDVQVVMANFKCGKQKGYYTDRGRVVLQYGMPSQRTRQNNEANTFPYEIWIYYRLVDRVNGQFFSNRRFVFVNKNLGDDCHTLVHSDMRGEISNPRWQFEVTRRNYDGIGDPDRESPAGIEHNQFNEIYKDPR
jgi:GWxTD domain-containing protein